ncbi:MAG: hypothetical protein HY940_01035 [Gammaproteobacteria bacterium]|nr:hypothetical protein [Gammaproteobacteria bacterium]
MKSSGMHQKGVAMLMGLIILLILTLLAVNGVRTTVFEKNMASNSQNQTVMFQAAESAIEGTVNDNSAIVSALSGAGVVTRNFTHNGVAGGPAISSTATVTGGASGPAVGYSISDFAVYPFTVESSATVGATSSQEKHVQGLQRVGPKL